MMMGGKIGRSASPEPLTCSSINSGLTTAAFILSIIGVCLGLAALIMTIINTVRIGRLRRRFAAATDSSENSSRANATNKKSNSSKRECGVCSSCVALEEIKRIIAAKEGTKEESIVLQKREGETDVTKS